MRSVEESPQTTLPAHPVADADREYLLDQLNVLEGTRHKPTWAWGLVVMGFVLAVAASYHGSLAYASIRAIDQRSDISTPNPGALFDAIATTGPRVGGTVENASRAAYGKALEQYVLDGTVVGLGLSLVLSGLYARLIR